MTIKYDSWHYRWAYLLISQGCDNLCAYFWRVVLTGVLMSMLITLSTAAITSVAALTFLFMAWLWFNTTAFLLAVMVLAGVVVAVIAALWVAIMTATKVVPAGFMAVHGEAKRRGLCPLLRYE